MPLKLDSVTSSKTNLPALEPGDQVKVFFKVREGEKERSQAFQGVVIVVKAGGVSSNFTVRRVTFGVGVERIFFFHSPLLEKVDVLRKGKVRRAKLFYLRKLSAKAARLKERRAPTAAAPTAAEEGPGQTS